MPVLYSVGACAPCAAAKAWLRRHRIPHEVRDTGNPRVERQWRSVLAGVGGGKVLPTLVIGPGLRLVLQGFSPQAYERVFFSGSFGAVYPQDMLRQYSRTEEALERLEAQLVRARPQDIERYKRLRARWDALPSRAVAAVPFYPKADATMAELHALEVEADTTTSAIAKAATAPPAPAPAPEPASPWTWPELPGLPSVSWPKWPGWPDLFDWPTLPKDWLLYGALGLGAYLLWKEQGRR